jgi:hypothetical protein
MPTPRSLDDTTVVQSIPSGDWPVAVHNELLRRAATIDLGPPGGVLDLATATGAALVPALGGRRLPAALAADPAEPLPPARAVVSVAALTGFADLAAAVAAVAAHLPVEGEFVFVEPVGRPGWRGLLGTSALSHLPAVRGRHVGRDVPAAVRRSGLLITDLERFEITTPVWPLRHWVQARAVKLPDPVSGPDPTEGAQA